VAGELARAVVIPGLVLYAVSLPVALVGLVLRFRASRGTERQQLRWVAAGATVAVLVLLPLPGKAHLPGFLTEVAVLAVPVSVAVAVLRYRLWDLDRLVSRTVTYALVTALLVLPYLLVVPAAGRLAAGTGSLGVAAATLFAAAAFTPLRRRVQHLVDRRFNRRRYDAAPHRRGPSRPASASQVRTWSALCNGELPGLWVATRPMAAVAGRRCRLRSLGQLALPT
jgi:hypothetical protein